jgi:hypothetical protein
MKIIQFALLLTLFAACKSEQEHLIVGKWSAARLVECDDIITIDTSIVNIEFKSNGQYIFNSTLNTHEEGTYKIKNGYLYTLDKLKANAGKKIVYLNTLNADSLTMEMNYKGKEQFLTFYRKGKDAIADNIAYEKKENTTPVKALSDTIATAIIANQGIVVPVSNPIPIADKKPEPKEDIAKKNTETENISPAEAYRRREALRKKEEAERIAEEKAKRDAYLKREAKRKEEAEEKRKSAREAYLKREAARKRDEAERKKKK